MYVCMNVPTHPHIRVHTIACPFKKNENYSNKWCIRLIALYLQWIHRERAIVRKARSLNELNCAWVANEWHSSRRILLLVSIYVHILLLLILYVHVETYKIHIYMYPSRRSVVHTNTFMAEKYLQLPLNLIDVLCEIVPSPPASIPHIHLLICTPWRRVICLSH